MRYLKLFISEMIGTFILVMLGCGTAIVTQVSVVNYPGYIATALAFGLAVIVAGGITSQISGTHINPIVSLSMFLDKRITIQELLVYIAGQMLGGIEGGFLLKYILGEYDGFAYCLNTLYQDDVLKTALIEMAMTAVLVLVVLTVTSEKFKDSKHSIWYVGATLTVLHLFGIGYDGVSVNPARTLGVAIAYGQYAFADLPGILIGSLIGGIFAWVIYKLISYIPVTSTKSEQSVMKKQTVAESPKQVKPVQKLKTEKADVELDQQKKKPTLKDRFSDLLFEDDVDDEDEIIIIPPKQEKKIEVAKKAEKIDMKMPTVDKALTSTSMMAMPKR